MGRRPQDDRSGGYTKNPEVPGGNSEPEQAGGCAPEFFQIHHVKNSALPTSCFRGSPTAADSYAVPCFLSLSFLIWGK